MMTHLRPFAPSLGSKRAAFLLAVLASAFVLPGCNISDATSCLKMHHDKQWALLKFINTCGTTINVILCNKFAGAEIGSIFSGKKAEWQCRRSSPRGGWEAGSLIWSTNNSSIITHAVSSSRYVVAACYPPAQPYITDLASQKFNCK